MCGPDSIAYFLLHLLVDCLLLLLPEQHVLVVPLLHVRRQVDAGVEAGQLALQVQPLRREVVVAAHAQRGVDVADHVLDVDGRDAVQAGV